MVNCKNCNNLLSEGEIKCSHCGYEQGVFKEEPLTDVNDVVGELNAIFESDNNKPKINYNINNVKPSSDVSMGFNANITNVNANTNAPPSFNATSNAMGQPSPSVNLYKPYENTQPSQLAPQGTNTQGLYNQTVAPVSGGLKAVLIILAIMSPFIGVIIGAVYAYKDNADHRVFGAKLVAISVAAAVIWTIIGTFFWAVLVSFL